MDKIHSKLFYKREKDYPFCLTKSCKRGLQFNTLERKMNKVSLTLIYPFTQPNWTSLVLIISLKEKFSRMKVNTNHKIHQKTHQKKRSKAFIKIKIILSSETWSWILKTSTSNLFIRMMELMNSRTLIYPNRINRINFYLNSH